MNFYSRNRFWIAGVFLGSMLLSACVPNLVSFAKIKPQTQTSMVIYGAMTRNYQGAHGVMNLFVDTEGFPGEFTPTSVQEKKELTAILWLVIVDRPETYASFQVQTGQTISFEGYVIDILRIGGSEQDGYYVEVDISDAP